MPGTLKVRVLAARDLPVMDRASETADAFVEMKFCQTAFKTDIFPKSLNPQWMSDWFTFEADDEELQDECLQFRVMDYDTYSANDAIGRVYLDLNPLLSKYGPSQIAGWLPIYDTMHGIRGELNVVVKIDLFTDINKFRQSSCGVDVFATPGIPHGYQLTAVHGLIEELLANDDPEYQWIDKIRTPRASNEARQGLFSKMAGQLVRRMGRKVLEMGGNAIISYSQCFDLEGEAGVVARGLGTGVTLEKLNEEALGTPGTPDLVLSSAGQLWRTPVAELEELSFGDESQQATVVAVKPQRITSERRTVSAAATVSSRDSSSSGGGQTITAESLDLDPNFIPLVRASSHSPASAAVSNSAPTSLLAGAGNLPKVQIIPGNDASGSKASHFRQLVGPSRTIDYMEYPFFTMQVFPVGFIMNIGSIVCARSVKLLSVIETPDEAEVRHSWWQELRTEIRSHMKAIACNSVIGYREQVSVFKDVCLLSASGTAAVVDPAWCVASNNPYVTLSTVPDSIVHQTSISSQAAPSIQSTPLDSKCVVAKDKESALNIDTALANRYSAASRISSSQDTFVCCSPCHIPYSETSLPFPVKLSICGCCGNAFVPNILLTTLDPLAELGASGDFTLVQARVVRRKQDLSGEPLADEISDMLPFIEHELHGQLVTKLLQAEKNAIFGLRTNLSVGESHVVVIATGTAVSLVALESTKSASVAARQRFTSSSADAEDSVKVQSPAVLVQQASEGVTKYAARSASHTAVVSKLSHSDSKSSGVSASAAATAIGRPPLDLAWDRDAVLAELNDQSEAESTKTAKLETDFPKNFYCCNTYFLPNVSDLNTGDMRQLQLFVRLWQGPIVEAEDFDTNILSERINWLVKSTCFKFRKMKPVCLTSVSCDVDFPQDDQYQVSFIGMVLTANAESPHLQYISQEQMTLGINQSLVSPYRRQRELSGGSGINFGRTQSIEEPTPNLDHHNIDPLSASCPTAALQNPALFRRRRISVAEETPAIKSRQIFVTPLTMPGHAPIFHYLGHYDFFFIRETTGLREAGGLESFTQSALTEVLYVVQAHVAAFGGHGMVAFRFTQIELSHNSNRNQAQCLVGVAGDIVTTLANPLLS